MKTPLTYLLLSSLLAGILAADILPGASISAGDTTQTWTSPNNTFTLSFISNPSSPNTFFAAISFNNIQIWSAGAAAVDSTATLTFLQNGNLRLVNGSSNGVVWQSNTSGLGVSKASLEETGNLVLKNGSKIVWSSFDNPTDTIMPGQNFTVRHELRNGLYSFKLLDNGNLTLLWNSSTMYYNSGLNSSASSNLTSPSLRLESIGILSLFDPKIVGSVIVAYSSDYAEAGQQRYVKLDDDGNLKIFSAAGGSKTERNFDPIDTNDPRKGCRRKVEISDCPGNATMLQLDHTRFLTYQPELASQVFFVGISACRLNCLVGPACGASTSLADGTGLCYLKNPDYYSGYQSPALPSTSYVKVCGPAQLNPTPNSSSDDKDKEWKLRAWIVVVVVLATLLVLVLLEGGIWWCCCRNSPKFGALSAQYALLDFGMVLLEIVSGRRNFYVSSETNQKKFSLWAYEEFENGNVETIVDKRLLGHEVDMEQVRRVIKISFWCIQEQPSQRPMMGKVVQMLEGIMEIEKPPAPKSVTEGSISGTSITASSNISALSTFATSAVAPSSSSSLQTAGATSFPSGRNVERVSSSLLRQEAD
ncbi:hypothetical protein POM88_046123 [Heracleum sosnowskyi]|uniref:non-specific serine/threonine protein kinase n=1 Tax=Heracleum sosnowskyi TaxID=360622 RepID=A0AAD8H8H0_9APIA|nr:hypothetical protein POM88_046123 [Heracleum sosnowskyi]